MGAITGRGEARRFYYEIVLSYEGDECLTWPYARDRNGYGVLLIPGRSSFVSRMLCEDAHGAPPTPRHEAAHGCGKGHLGCVNKRHLEWKTRAQNLADRLVHDTHVRGQRHPLAKLTEANAREIFALGGAVSQRDLAKRYGVSRGTVRNVLNGNSWAWSREVA